MVGGKEGKWVGEVRKGGGCVRVGVGVWLLRATIPHTLPLPPLLFLPPHPLPPPLVASRQWEGVSFDGCGIWGGSHAKTWG